MATTWCYLVWVSDPTEDSGSKLKAVLYRHLPVVEKQAKRIARGKSYSVEKHLLVAAASL
jgi:hypothetical protein